MSKSTALPATITGTIDRAALGRVTRMYTARVEDTMREVMQNARRARATRITVTIENLDNDGAAITVEDNGDGIGEPALTLRYGANGWSKDIVEREDAAGMGMLALAHGGCTVESRTRKGAGAGGWRATLAPEHFRGEAKAAVEPCPGAPEEHGTRVRFEIAGAWKSAASAVEEAARHLDVPVVMTTPQTPATVVERRDYLGGATYRERWKGIDIGVAIDATRGLNRDDVCFHGVTVRAGLATVIGLDGRWWRAKAQVHNAGGLTLVLPQRKEVVANEQLQALRQASLEAVWRAMATNRDPRPSWKTWSDARAAGIHMPEHPPVLERWRAESGDPNYDSDPWRRERSGTIAANKAILAGVLNDADRVAQHELERAIVLNPHAPEIARNITELKGYPWYDAVASVRSLVTKVSIDGIERLPGEHPRRDDSAGQRDVGERADTITMTLGIAVRGAQHNNTASRITLKTDLVFGTDSEDEMTEAGPIVTKDSTLTPSDLEEILIAAWFCPNSDFDSDSYEHQRQEADRNAEYLALLALADRNEADRARIANIATAELAWLVPRGKRATIAIENHTTTVEIAQSRAAGA